MTRQGRGRSASKIADGVTAFLALIWLVPLFFSILISIRPQSDPITQGNIFFGSTITLKNYEIAWEVAPWHYHYFTSVVFVVGVLVVQLVTITMAGYAFARMRFLGRNVLLFLILTQLMIPPGVLIVQKFAIIKDLGLFDTRLALMIPYWGSAFGTLLVRQTFRGIPIELEEAGKLDGANWLQLMRHIYLPLSIPAYIAFSLVSITSHWNEFLWPFIVTRSETVRPVTVGLNKLLQTADVGALYGQLMAGTLLVIAPLVIVFLIFQRQFIESFLQSGIK